MMFFVVSCRVTCVMRELGVKKKKEEGQKHGQKGKVVTLCTDHVWFPTKDKHGNQQRYRLAGSNRISNYKAMWQAHGNQVIDHMIRK